MVALDGDNIVGHVLLSAAMLVNDHEAMSILSLVSCGGTSRVPGERDWNENDPMRVGKR